MEKTISKPMKDPLVHIAKKDTITTGKLIGIKAIALLLAFLISSIILGISEGCDPFNKWFIWNWFKYLDVIKRYGNPFRIRLSFTSGFQNEVLECWC